MHPGLMAPSGHNPVPPLGGGGGGSEEDGALKSERRRSGFGALGCPRAQEGKEKSDGGIQQWAPSAASQQPPQG